MNDDTNTTVESARDLIRTGLKSFVGDPPDSPFQRGYLEALYVIGREGLGMDLGEPPASGEPKRAISHLRVVT